MLIKITWKCKKKNTFSFTYRKKVILFKNTIGVALLIEAGNKREGDELEEI